MSALNVVVAVAVAVRAIGPVTGAVSRRRVCVGRSTRGRDAAAAGCLGEERRERGESSGGGPAVVQNGVC